MPTAGVPGITMVLSIQGAALAESTDFTLVQGQEEIDMTSRDSAFWKESYPGFRDWTISGNMLHIYNDAARQFLDWHWHGRSPRFLTVILTLAYAEGGSPNITKQGQCYVTNLTFDGPHAGAAVNSFSLKGTHELEITAS